MSSRVTVTQAGVEVPIGHVLPLNSKLEPVEDDKVLLNKHIPSNSDDLTEYVESCDGALEVLSVTPSYSQCVRGSQRRSLRFCLAVIAGLVVVVASTVIGVTMIRVGSSEQEDYGIEDDFFNVAGFSGSNYDNSGGNKKKDKGKDIILTEKNHDYDFYDGLEKSVGNSNIFTEEKDRDKDKKKTKPNSNNDNSRPNNTNGNNDGRPKNNNDDKNDTKRPSNSRPNINNNNSLSDGNNSNSRPNNNNRPKPTPSPSRRGPSPSPTVAFVPGDLSVKENGLILSRGLQSQVIAVSGQPVIYRNGRRSRANFHKNPDGGAVFADPEGRGWVYVSNSELEKSKGGVGALRFDGKGRVIDYRMILERTTKNCSGGSTPWNTWLSAEENKAKGRVFETDPFGKKKSRVTVLGIGGGAFESVAVDNRNPDQPVFFVTHDKKSGELRRYRPKRETVRANIRKKQQWRILTQRGGRMDYLVLDPTRGTFTWSKRREDGMKSAEKNFNNLEGIDCRDGVLMFVSKKQNELFTLDLDKSTYRKESTNNHLFNGSPDQLARFMDQPESEMIFFTEEHGKKTGVGVHARDANGNYHTILLNDADKVRRQETTGLAFSPDNRFMYFGFYKLGVIFAVSRKDGLPFHGTNLSLRHHDMEITKKP